MRSVFLGVMTFSIAACAMSSTGRDAASVDGSRSSPKAIYQADGWAAKSLPDLRDALQRGEISALELTKIYLDRIEKIDRNGPTLQSVLTINPDVLEIARALDEKQNNGEPLGSLHGLPVLLKDNIESADQMPTTAGALALKDNVTGRDAPLTAGLRDAGAIILGKTNLSQWANFRSNDSMSGWSALGGQVRNPHMLDRNPCGSSSGSGAAIAASLGAGAVGTETNGSIICPSNVNGVVGFKPTVGLVSQQYIVPISSSQDTAGPMTKTVTGAAMMLSAMASGEAAKEFAAMLDANSLKGLRVGVARFEQGSNVNIIAKFDAALAELESAGAVLVDISEFETPDGFWSNSRDVLRYEFKATLNEYLSSTPDMVTTRTLNELIEFNNANADVELALFDQSIFETSQKMGAVDSDDYLQKRDAVQTATRENGVDKLLSDFDVDVLVSPSGPLSPRIDPVNGDVWPDWAGAGWMAAIAGYPHLTVPMGDVRGVPIGLSFIGAKNADASVLSYGYAYEQRTHLRREPKYLPSAETRDDIARAMAPGR